MSQEFESNKSKIPWEIVMPATLFCASIICWQDPSKAPAIAFFFLACFLMTFDTVVLHFTKPVSDGLSIALTQSMSSFADEENSAQTDLLLDALANSIGRALQSNSLKNTIKASFIETVCDDDLQSATIATLQMAMKKAADNDEFKQTCFDVTKRAFVGALSDDLFIKEAIESAVAAMVTASQDEVLRQSVLSVVTQGVSDALHDDEFIAEFRKVIKDCLSDGEIYRSGARGVLNAAFGGKKKDSTMERTDSATSHGSDAGSSGKKGSAKQITNEQL